MFFTLKSWKVSWAWVLSKFGDAGPWLSILHRPTIRWNSSIRAYKSPIYLNIDTYITISQFIILKYMLQLESEIQLRQSCTCTMPVTAKSLPFFHLCAKNYLTLMTPKILKLHRDIKKVNYQDAMTVDIIYKMTNSMLLIMVIRCHCQRMVNVWFYN